MVALSKEVRVCERNCYDTWRHIFGGKHVGRGENHTDMGDGIADLRVSWGGF